MAIMYLSTLVHRGTSNRAEADRTVVDFHYMLPESALKYDYLKHFPQHVLADMQRHNERFFLLCSAAGQQCEPFAVPLTEMARRTDASGDAMPFSLWPSLITGAAVLVGLVAGSALGLW